MTSRLSPSTPAAGAAFVNGRTGTTGAPAGLAGPAPAAASTATGTTAAGPLTPPPKLRRRPALIAAAVALIALGGAGAAWLTTSVGNTRPVLALRTDVQRGDLISAEDLITASLNADPAVRPVPAARRDDMIGRRAATDLPAGSLLTDASLTDTPIPADGQALVGVSVLPGQLPARPLRAGQTVRIVDTPRAQEDPPTGTPASTSAVVVVQHPPADTGQIVIDVTVPNDQADALAARVATGRVAVVLSSERL